MSVFWKTLACLVIVTLLTVGRPSCAFACSCAPPGPPEEALANATAVFAGRVTALNAPADRGGATPVQVTFAVAQAWKGIDQATVVITTPASSASCGVDFVEGQEFLVYAQDTEGQLQANLCSRTTQLASADADLAALGQGKTFAAATGEVEIPASLPDTGRNTVETFLLPGVLAAGALLVLIGGVIGVSRRRRQVDQ